MVFLFLFSNMNNLFDFWPYLFIAAAIQGMILSITIFSQKEHKLNNQILGILVFLFSISLLDNVFFWTEFYKTNAHVLGISLTFPLLYGPLFFLYLKETNSGSKSFQPKTLLAFIPFLIAVLYLLPYYLSNHSEKLDLISNWNKNIIRALLIPVVGVLSLIIYNIKSLLFIKTIEQKQNVKILIKHHWLGYIFKAFTLFVLFSIIHFVVIMTGNSSRIGDIIVALGLSFFIYYIGYTGIRMSKLLNGIKINSTKYQSTTLTKDFAQETYFILIEYMEKEQPYLNNNLKLPDLANSLAITPHQLSQIINEKSNQNFSEFINTYRIKTAINLIHEFKQITDLAYEVGFNNRTSFNYAFKKMTGLTPTQYKKTFNSNRFE